MARTATAVFKRRLKQMLHNQLDAILNGETQEEGVTMSALEGMTLRAMRGFAFNVSVSSLHPNQTKPVEPEPTVKPGAALGIVRE